ncbi:MAG: hypothetical protein V7724_14775 [Sediminicola sp.]
MIDTWPRGPMLIGLLGFAQPVAKEGPWLGQWPLFQMVYFHTMDVSLPFLKWNIVVPLFFAWFPYAIFIKIFSNLDIFDLKKYNILTIYLFIF